jgi:hypothetical protein
MGTALTRALVDAGDPPEAGAELQALRYIPRMSMAAGVRLGRHEILAPLASGGMGAAYRARDPL